jgi:hypothetical protein
VFGAAAYSGRSEGEKFSEGENSGEESLGGRKRWQLSIGFRKQRSHRHFVGTVEQHEREEQQTEIVNDIYLWDVSLSYDLTPRYSLSVSVPFMAATRTRPATLDRIRGVRNPTEQVSHSIGFGDITVGARMWLFNPTRRRATKGNIAFGVALKMPTGNEGVKDTVQTSTGPREIVVDQSIQLGDGGWGVALGTEMYRRLGKVTLYGSASYLLNPRDTNGVPTGRGRPSEAIMSVADQYLARGGVIVPVKRMESWAVSLSLGGRIEGIPPRDLIGKSNGFRRPGYSIAVEPGINFVRGDDVWTMSVPIAVKRNRQRSVSDVLVGGHGDAAFADYLITVGYSRRF